MGKTNITENGLLNQILRATTYTTPANIVLSLHTASPNDVGSVGREVSPTGYVRQTCSFDAPNASNQCLNSSTITFSITTWASATTVTHWALHDLTAGGNMYYYGAFDQSKSFSGSDNVVINAGDLYVEER